VAGRPLAPNPAGAHFLRDRTLIARLARASGARTGGLVLDLGAGSGAITAGLAATGARVIAVERDPKLAARLRRRFDCVVQWGAARWLSAQRPRDAETAWWSARYEIDMARVVKSASFAPPPRVDAAWLSVRPRPVPISGHGQRRLRAIVRAAYRRPGIRTDIALAVRKRLLLRAGLDPAAPVAEVTADQWHRLAVLLDGGTARVS
jgi:23S rRNA (adenine-N6)-dimethyltransferase